MNQHQDESCSYPFFIPYLISEIKLRKNKINKQKYGVVLLLMSHSVYLNHSRLQAKRLWRKKQ